MARGSDPTLVDYYSRRAREYDCIYERPERAEDLAALRRSVADWLRGRRVLEIACGTGWWTAVVAPVARSIVATDASTEVLEVARERLRGDERVTFRAADAFALDRVAGDFDAALAGFWISHVDRGELRGWLGALHARLGPGARVVLFDNRFVAGSSTPVSRRDDDGNTFQVRRLASGEETEIRKNFLEEPELRALLAATVDPQFRISEFYWAVCYTVPRRKADA